MEPDERAIREVHSTWVDAVNAGDLKARLLTLMTDDVVISQSGPRRLRWDGFSAAFSAAHQQARIRCISELEEVVVVGEVAYTRARDSLSVIPRSTSTSSGAGRGGNEKQAEAMQLAGHRMTVYRKQPDGRGLLGGDAHIVVTGGDVRL